MAFCCSPWSLKITNKGVHSLIMHAGMCGPFANEVQAFIVRIHDIKRLKKKSELVYICLVQLAV